MRKDSHSQKGKYEFYRLIHKGVRGLLLDLVILAGKTSTDSNTEINRLQQTCHITLDYLLLHEEYKETYINPLLAQKHFSELNFLEETISSVRKNIADLKQQIDAFSAGKKVPSEVFYGFYAKLSIFSAQYINHLHYEETTLTEFFWKHYTDEDLLSTHLKLQKNETKESVIESITLVFKYFSIPELLAGFKRVRIISKTVEIYKEYLKHAKKALDEEVWDQIYEIIKPKAEENQDDTTEKNGCPTTEEDHKSTYIPNETEKFKL